MRAHKITTGSATPPRDPARLQVLPDVVLPDGEPLLTSIVVAAAEAQGVTPDVLAQRGRLRRFARARQAGMWIAFHATMHSTPEIGAAFGRDHTTVIHAVRVTARRLAAGDELVAEEIASVLDGLAGKPLRYRFSAPDGSGLPVWRPQSKQALVRVSTGAAEIDRLRRRRWSVNAIADYLEIAPADVARYLGVAWTREQAEVMR